MANFGVCTPTKDPCKCIVPDYSIGGMCFKCQKTRRVITDTERLDFIFGNTSPISCERGWYIQNDFARNKYFYSPRDAIDAAMKEQDK